MQSVCTGPLSASFLEVFQQSGGLPDQPLVDRSAAQLDQLLAQSVQLPFRALRLPLSSADDLGELPPLATGATFSFRGFGHLFDRLYPSVVGSLSVKSRLGSFEVVSMLRPGCPPLRDLFFSRGILQPSVPPELPLFERISCREYVTRP